jgi:uncharacterized protein YndB with AHSA1/START domain
MLKKILLIAAALVVALVAAVLIAASLKPDTFRIERSAVLAASPQALFEQVNDPRKFNAWNPWLKLDPQVKNTFSGPASGVGAACSWAGNGDVGEGTSTITESKPNELVCFKMEFRKPMEGVSTCDFTFVPQGDQTKVTWSMHGPQPFVGKVMSVFIDCDKMCGDQFEKGLASLGEAAQAKP